MGSLEVTVGFPCGGTDCPNAPTVFERTASTLPLVMLVTGRLSIVRASTIVPTALVDIGTTGVRCGSGPVTTWFTRSTLPVPAAFIGTHLPVASL